MRKLKILISSVGSLVGQNILDVLEYPEFRRRELTTIIGTNSISSSPNNFRCDKFYRMPNTASNGFRDLIINVLENEEPDLILSGRDEDTETLAKIILENKNKNVKSPYGEIKTLTIALDKWETWKFTQRYNLPFAETFQAEDVNNQDMLIKFIEQFNYPLIAKPRRGFASKGVFFINNFEEAEMTLQNKNYILQEYLGNGKTLKEYFDLMKGPTPLFAHAPNIHHYSCHVIINPIGELSPIFVSKNEHNSGMTVGFRKVKNEELENLTVNYAKALFSEGGYGPLTVQFKLDKNNNWKAQELNFRTNGNTFPRFLLGQDDLGLIINGVLPEFEFPIYNIMEDPHQYIIGKSLRSDVMKKNDLSTIENEQYWERSQEI